ncbi:YciI family protein [Catenulispora subtropica]
MDFFCYHRDRAGSLPLRQALLEEHWSYMDRFEEQMIARGPVFEEEGDDAGLLGSVHIATFSDAAAARTFAFEEPGYQAGAYRDVMLRRWRNDLGRTMWEFPGGRPDGDGYVVVGLGVTAPVAQAVGPADAGGLVGGLIAYGPLLSDDGRTWVGTAALLRAPDRDTARAVLGGDAGRYTEIEVHSWEFGGRR